MTASQNLQQRKTNKNEALNAQNPSGSIHSRKRVIVDCHKSYSSLEFTSKRDIK